MALQQINNEGRTLPAIIESIQRQANAGIASIDNRFNPIYLQSIVIFGRAELLKTIYTGNRGMASNHYIHEAWKQEYELVYDPLLQTDDCWNHFECPDPISLDDVSNGFRYIGNKKGNNNYMILHSTEQYADYLNDANMVSIMNTKILSLYDGGNRIIKLRNCAPDFKGIKSGKVRAVFANPLDIPSYNIDTDIFPMDGNSVNSLISAIWTTIRFAAYGKPDMVADGSDETQQAQLTRAITNMFLKQAANAGI